MSWWQLATLIICVGFRKLDVLDLEIFFSEIDWAIFENLSSAMPSKPSAVTIFQVRGMSWWKWATLISCVGFRSHDGSELDLVIYEIP